MPSRLRWACSVCGPWTPPDVICGQCFLHSRESMLFCQTHWEAHSTLHTGYFSLFQQAFVCGTCSISVASPWVVRKLAASSPSLWKGQTGCWNLGYTCYMNAALQCLFRCPGVQEYFVEVGQFYVDELRGFPLFAKTQELASLLLNSDEAVVPRAFVNTVFQEFPFLQRGRQQDAHEFFHLLIDYLNEALGNHSFISTVFRGVLLQKQECSGCNNVSVREEEFYELQLPINEDQQDSGLNLLEATDRKVFTRMIKPSFQCWRPKQACTVYACLNEFFRPVQLDEASLCEACGESQKASLWYVLKEAPNVLVLVFKRFAFVRGRGHKVKSHVQLARTLQSPCLATNDNSAYTLFAVIEHSGGLNAGHYRAYVKSPLPGYWIRYNDRRLTYVRETTVLQVQAYLAFYSQQPGPERRPTCDTEVAVPKEWMIGLRRLQQPRALRFKQLGCPHNLRNPLANSRLFEFVSEHEFRNIQGNFPSPEDVVQYEFCVECTHTLNSEYNKFQRETSQFDLSAVLAVDNRGYLVAASWFKLWMHYMLWNETCLSLPSAVEEVKNERLVETNEEESTLKNELRQGTDYVIVTSEVWAILKQLYGCDIEIKQDDEVVVTHFK